VNKQELVDWLKAQLASSSDKRDSYLEATSADVSNGNDFSAAWNLLLSRWSTGASDILVDVITHAQQLDDPPTADALEQAREDGKQEGIGIGRLGAFEEVASRYNQLAFPEHVNAIRALASQPAPAIIVGEEAELARMVLDGKVSIWFDGPYCRTSITGRLGLFEDTNCIAALRAAAAAMESEKPQEPAEPPLPEPRLKPGDRVEDSQGISGIVESVLDETCYWHSDERMYMVKFGGGCREKLCGNSLTRETPAEPPLPDTIEGCLNELRMLEYTVSLRSLQRAAPIYVSSIVAANVFGTVGERWTLQHLQDAVAWARKQKAGADNGQ
jgi:hypothetical protein